MISGLIIYNATDRKKNSWFINRCLKGLNDDSFSLFYLDEDEVINYLKDHQVDFVINRSRNSSLIKQLENLGIRCFNNYLTNKIANDKYATYLFLKENDIPCLKSTLDINTITNYPIVMKRLNGHGGQEVYLVNNKEEALAIEKAHPSQYLYQKYYPNSGDLRLYVLNQKVIAAVLRSNSSDFRSNYSLGGTVSLVKPDPSLVETALQIERLLNATYLGVDFLKVNDTYLVNEIEDPVGARMLYQTSDIDIIDLFIKCIKQSLNK